MTAITTRATRRLGKCAKQDCINLTFGLYCSDHGGTTAPQEAQSPSPCAHLRTWSCAGQMGLDFVLRMLAAHFPAALYRLPDTGEGMDVCQGCGHIRYYSTDGTGGSGGTDSTGRVDLRLGGSTPSGGKQAQVRHKRGPGQEQPLSHPWKRGRYGSALEQDDAALEQYADGDDDTTDTDLADLWLKGHVTGEAL